MIVQILQTKHNVDSVDLVVNRTFKIPTQNCQDLYSYTAILDINIRLKIETVLNPSYFSNKRNMTGGIQIDLFLKKTTIP